MVFGLTFDWIVAWTDARPSSSMHYVGPFPTQLQAALWEAKFLHEHPNGHVTQVARLEAPPEERKLAAAAKG